MSVVNRGDPYILEVSGILRQGASEQPKSLPSGLEIPKFQVEPSAWMGIKTSEALKGLTRLEYAKEGEEVRFYHSLLCRSYV